MKNIAFIGLGAMGIAMANNILKGGHNVVGYDRDEARLALHSANGGKIASSPAEAAKDADIVITMLPVGAIVKSALFDAGGITETMSPDALFIDMSTIHPLESDDIRAELTKHGITMIDAPVGRTSLDAIKGTLIILAGTDTDSLERARSVFECMGEIIIDCGGPGKGIRIKVVNNFMSVALSALTAECLALSDKLGLDRNLAIEVMSGTPAATGHMLTTYPKKVFQNDLSPAFPIDLANKDLLISLDLAEALDINMEMGRAASYVYKEAQNEGRGNQDWTALYDMLSPAKQIA
ncbi:sulfolactaldehyde 3-reductase [Amphritea sp. 1_MG-2023]|uniref:sulfolactaldehyde 3-reductase n=1 Tax=Amphritea sp. 1_MG-2023 TaxID=3062670 RepID=UPI0026E19DA6|nr:sulfolactaldehyde 3-reductase [Amphritea sp. 1_MG-2023]MDO6564388.1 sulfolactaldehyde 3-reductase [Amphritea sp. 1_MG-2023]